MIWQACVEQQIQTRFSGFDGGTSSLDIGMARESQKTDGGAWCFLLNE